MSMFFVVTFVALVGPCLLVDYSCRWLVLDVDDFDGAMSCVVTVIACPSFCRWFGYVHVLCCLLSWLCFSAHDFMGSMSFMFIFVACPCFCKWS